MNIVPKCEPIARELERARQARTVIAPPSTTALGLTIDDGYLIQQAWTDLRCAQGQRSCGYKIGFTSRHMQRAYGVASPLFGRLFECDLLAGGEALEIARYFRPHLELELAFTMGARLDAADPTLADILRATEYVQPALEIIDYRTTTPRPVPDMVADNTAGAGAILSGQRSDPRAIDMTRIAAVLTRNGEVEDTGVSAAVLGHPANAVAALARHLAKYGQCLLPGDVILSGAFSGMVEIRAGDVIWADYGPVGEIRLALG